MFSLWWSTDQPSVSRQPPLNELTNDAETIAVFHSNLDWNTPQPMPPTIVSWQSAWKKLSKEFPLFKGKPWNVPSRSFDQYSVYQYVHTLHFIHSTSSTAILCLTKYINRKPSTSCSPDFPDKCLTSFIWNHSCYLITEMLNVVIYIIQTIHFSASYINGSQMYMALYVYESSQYVCIYVHISFEECTTYYVRRYVLIFLSLLICSTIL